MQCGHLPPPHCVGEITTDMVEDGRQHKVAGAFPASTRAVVGVCLSKFISKFSQDIDLTTI